MKIKKSMIKIELSEEEAVELDRALSFYLEPINNHDKLSYGTLKEFQLQLIEAL